MIINSYFALFLCVYFAFLFAASTGKSLTDRVLQTSLIVLAIWFGIGAAHLFGFISFNGVTQ